VLEGLRAAGVEVLRHEQNRGLANARNTGLAAARTPYVFPLDADDLAVEGALAWMADRLDEHPDAAVCFGDYLEFGTHELVRAVPARLDPYRVAYTNEYPVAALFRRAVLEGLGGWRKGAAGYEDWHLWMTLAEQGYSGVHAGEGVLTFRRRLHGERMLAEAKRQHRRLYGGLRDDHPRLFGEIRMHRRSSDLSLSRKFLYPLVYGGRPRFRFEQSVKRKLDRLGIWTLRR
jgi:glycosyltransferase involved in cell wall biosynthesis